MYVVGISKHEPDFAVSPLWIPKLGAFNTGDDIAGYIEKVGAGVTEFKVGDRVGAFHEMMKPHGSFAEYAIAWAKTTFHIPEKTSFEEAATIPLAAMTAAVGLVCGPVTHAYSLTVETTLIPTYPSQLLSI